MERREREGEGEEGEREGEEVDNDNCGGHSTVTCTVHNGIQYMYTFKTITNAHVD